MIKQTSQIFSIINKIVGTKIHAKCWGVGERHVYRWGANSDYCDDCGRNPIDRLITALKRVDELGRDDAVESVLEYIVGLFGYKLIHNESAVCSDKQSATLEILDVNSALGDITQKLQQSLMDGKIDEDERSGLLQSTSNLIRQAMELKDAIYQWKN